MDNNKKKDALEALIQQNTDKGYVLEDDVDEICDQYDLSDLEYNWILNALETRNITVFEKEPAPSFFTHESQLVSEPESASHKENKDELLYGITLQMQYKGRKAHCRLMQEGCLLLKKSQICRSCNANSPPSLLQNRQLYDSKIDWTYGELLEDILLSSPTAAFEFVTGNSHDAAGRIWKDEHGTTLFELRKNANASQVTESNVVESFSPKPETSTSSQEKQGYLPNGSILYMEHEHGEAICRYTYSNEEDYYTLLKGSIVNTTVSPDCPSYIQTSRERNKDKISETGELLANILLKGVNRSAGFVTGKREDGLQLWHDDEGHTLYSLIYQRDKIDVKNTADFTDTDASRDTSNETEFTEIEIDTSDIAAAADGTDTDALRDTSNETEFTETERARQEIEQRKREEILQMPIKNLGLSFRTFSSLRRARINTIGELIEQNENHLMKAVRNFGKKSFNEVRSKLQSLGLDFKNNEED